VALRELVDAKVNHLPIPRDQAPKARNNKVVNLMDALRKSVADDRARIQKKPPAREPAPDRKGLGLVSRAKTASKRRLA
jgi:DNA end-binding protein Ku